MLGESAELAVAKSLTEQGLEISVPFSDGSPYDLVADTGTELFRIQVKSVDASDGVAVVSFERSNYTASGRKDTYYSADEVDLFAAYCRDRDATLIFPFSEVPRTKAHFNFDYQGNSSQVRAAEEYLIENLSTDGNF